MREPDPAKLRFPIGPFVKPASLNAEVIHSFIRDIQTFPERLRIETENLSDEQFDTPYRPQGWTIRQVVHHCADSHMNSLTRFKLALTEDSPVIRPYFEDRWAELEDSKFLAVEPSLQLLSGLHVRWVVLLKSLSANDMEKVFIHPEHGKEFRIDETIGMYAWHCNHHLAHITELKKRKGWGGESPLKEPITHG